MDREYGSKFGLLFRTDDRNPRNAIIFGVTGCLPIDIKIRTPKGLKRLRDLKKNDIIFSYNFKRKEIEKDKSIRFDVGRKDMLKIHLKSGRILICSLEHRWFIKNKNKIEIKEAKNLKIGNNMVVINAKK